MKLIGITGRAGAGKDTVGRILCDYVCFVRISFADPIRAMIQSLGIDCTNRDTKEKPVPWIGRSPRYLMQTLGTEWGRNLVDPEIWIKAAARRIDTMGADIVVTDVRFDNEAKMIQDRGGLIWQVIRPGIRRVEAHRSEAGISTEHIDRVISNNGSVETLIETVMTTFMNDWPQR